MSGKLEKTINAVYGIPVVAGYTQIKCSTPGVTVSGQLDSQEMYTIQSDGAIDYCLVEEGAALTGANGKGVFLPSGEQAFVSTDKRYYTLAVHPHAGNSNACNVFCTKLIVRGI